MVLTAMIGAQRCENHSEKRGRIFARIYQMRKRFLGVAIPSQALREAEPGRQTVDNRTNDEILFHALRCVCE